MPFAARPHPHLYEINAWTWLEELSTQSGKRITLGGIPAAEWDRLASLGFDYIWLMGVWERSAEGRRLFQTDPAEFAHFDAAVPGWRVSEVVGSPYSIRNYSPDPRIGLWAELDAVRDALHERRMGLILDFVPNHTGFDHPWISSHPEYYVQGKEEDFHRSPSAYWLSEAASAAPRFIARGCDPYFPPWKDVAQLNYCEPRACAALLRVLQEIARHCDGVRCDMAMLVLNEIFARTWGAQLAGYSAAEEEFWTAAVRLLPGFLWLAEVYWDLEPRLQGLGFNFTYDKKLYDQLRDGNAGAIRAGLRGDPTAQSRNVRFLENHDEPRAASVFAGRVEAAAVLTATLPGMRFYHQGQFEGKKVRHPIPLARMAAEPADSALQSMYTRLLGLSNLDVFHSGEWKPLDVSSAGDASYQNLVAYQWRSASSWKLIVANVAGGTAQGRVRLEGQISAAREFVFLDELHDARYPRKGEELAREGLYVRLDSFSAHLFDIS
ncbi:MAG: alpha-amylase family glycosyl hydrolase [Candidatus Acidiferrales bacterium]